MAEPAMHSSYENKGMLCIKLLEEYVARIKHAKKKKSQNKTNKQKQKKSDNRVNLVLLLFLLSEKMRLRTVNPPFLH